MPINIEILTQSLDALSFVLVTPEFMGEQTLESIRKFLRAFSNLLVRIQEKALSFGERDVFDYLLLMFFIVSLLFLAFVGDNTIGSYFKQTVVFRLLATAFVVLAWGLFISTIGFAIVSVSLYLIFSIASVVLYRRIMFSVGVILFFSSRTIAVWHAWGS
jgi:hypothetical protein